MIELNSLNISTAQKNPFQSDFPLDLNDVIEFRMNELHSFAFQLK